MKKTILFFALIVSALTIQAQDEATLYQKEIGIDGFFINRFLPINNNIGIRAPYLLSYRTYKPDNKFIRLGLNADWATQGDEDITTSDIDVEFLLGTGKYKEIMKKTTIFYGVDFLTSVSNQRLVQEDDTVSGIVKSTRTVTDLGIGVGPSAGIQYNFVPRFGVYTEFSFHTNLIYQLDSFVSDLSVEQSTDTSFRWTGGFNLPGHIVFFFKF